MFIEQKNECCDEIIIIKKYILSFNHSKNNFTYIEKININK